MYRSLLRDGQPAPEIVEDGGDVVVVLSGGPPDLAVRAFFDDLARDRRVAGGDDDVVSLIALSTLFETATLTAVRLRQRAQVTESEALAVMRSLQAAKVVSRVSSGADEWALAATRGDASRIAFVTRNVARSTSTLA